MTIIFNPSLLRSYRGRDRLQTGNGRFDLSTESANWADAVKI